MTYPARLLLLFGGCVVLGVGVGLLLTADLGSDGYSTLVNGLTVATDMSFWIMNLIVGVVFVGLAVVRGVVPGIGTVVQVVLVGVTVSVVLELLSTPESLAARIAVLALSFPLLAVGIAVYLGSRTGAGPVEGAGLAWDPPVPFKWSYNLVQAASALVGWLLGATVGVGTVLVILLLGPLVDITARLLRLDVHQQVRGELDPQDS